MSFLSAQVRFILKKSWSFIIQIMAQDITLLWGGGSRCWRIMIALEEKGLAGYNQKLLSFDKMEHKSEEVLSLNPRGQVGRVDKGITNLPLTTFNMPVIKLCCCHCKCNNRAVVFGLVPLSLIYLMKERFIKMY